MLWVKNSGRVIIWLIVSINRLSSWERYTQERNWNSEVIDKATPSTFALKIVYLFLLKQKYKPHVENCEESKNAYNPASQKLKPTGNIFFCGRAHALPKFLGWGSNPYHGSDPRHSSDHTGSLKASSPGMSTGNILSFSFFLF